MTAQTPIIAPIFRNRGEPDLIMSEAVHTALCRAMDRVAKREMSMAHRRGTFTASQRDVFDRGQTQLAERGATGGTRNSGRVRGVFDPHDWSSVIAAIDAGATTAPAISAVIERSYNTVHHRTRAMVKAGLLSWTGPANGQRVFAVTEAGRAWMEGVQ